MMRTRGIRRDVACRSEEKLADEREVKIFWLVKELLFNRILIQN